MRRILSLSAALALFGGLGCTHEVCDCCQDVCGNCGCHTTSNVPAAMPGVKTEDIKKMPKTLPEAPKGEKKAEAGKEADAVGLDE
jgi:hypothetical protein